MTTFERLASEVQKSWDSGAWYASRLEGVEGWQGASRFSPVVELDVHIGQQSRAFEAEMFGRKAVWAYVQVGSIVWGVRGHDVEPDVVVGLAAQMRWTGRKDPGSQFTLRMPSLHGSTEGTIERWLVDLDQHVTKYELLVRGRWGDVITEIPSPVDGSLINKFVLDGHTVPTGTQLADFLVDDPPI